jgi:t-SNARE complex subunit (syntaxin)
MTDEELKALFDRNEAKIDGLGEALRGEMRAQAEGLRLELRGEMRAQGEELRGEMRAQGEELRGEMRAQGEELRLEFRGEIRELRSEMVASHADLRRHFDETVENFDAKYDLLAEGIMNLNEKMDRNNADIRQEMRQGFADTHDLIKYAYNLARQPR